MSRIGRWGQHKKGHRGYGNVNSRLPRPVQGIMAGATIIRIVGFVVILIAVIAGWVSCQHMPLPMR
jgi:hypothetical protein